MTIGIRERYLCALLGALIGDIRGAPFEHKRAKEIVDIYMSQGGIKPIDYPNPWEKNPEKRDMIEKSQPTDDSELLAALINAFILSPEFNPALIYNWLRKFIIRREPILSKRPFGSGGTLRSALEPETYYLSLIKFGSGEVIMAPSNGALMRNTAIYLRYHGNEENLVRYARWQSCITHMHSLSQVACIAHALWGSNVLDGFNPLEAWDQTVFMLSNKKYAKIPDLDAILSLDPTLQPTQEELWPGDKDHTGHVILSLRVALWACCTADNYAKGIEKCILIGGDTDTYAAIAGGILGAHRGYASIPPDWLEATQGREIMKDFSDQLYKLAHS